MNAATVLRNSRFLIEALARHLFGLSEVAGVLFPYPGSETDDAVRPVIHSLLLLCSRFSCVGRDSRTVCARRA